MSRIGVLVIVALAAISAVLARSDDPLSDEFIAEINRKATTWQVMIIWLVRMLNGKFRVDFECKT